MLSAAFDRLATRLQPPAWVIDEVQHRLVLLLNHVLQQESEAMARLARQKGRVVLAQWRSFAIRLVATPAGLLDVAAPDAQPDLTLAVLQASPFELVQAAVRGDKPAVRIEGDVELAAEVSWLVDHVRWDAEEDLSRVLGDAPAHALGQAVRSLVDGLRQFIGARAPVGPGKAQP
jgi:ubiquinone biosynthesis protein UbiJ